MGCRSPLTQLPREHPDLNLGNTLLPYCYQPSGHLPASERQLVFNVITHLISQENDIAVTNAASVLATLAS